MEENDYAGRERRLYPTWQQEVSRLEEQFAKHYQIDEDMHTRTERLLEAIHEDMQTVKEIVSAWNNLKGAGMVLQFMGKMVKWAAGIAAACGGLYLLFKGGGK